MDRGLQYFSTSVLLSFSTAGELDSNIPTPTSTSTADDGISIMM
jgi:hypothetical protein